MQIVSLSVPPRFDFVSATGPDAAKFLQGQLSCDLRQLSQSSSLIGVLCNLKGRVIADFRLLQTSKDTILLQCSSGIGSRVVQTLSRYAVFSKVELQLIDGPVAIFGLIGGQSIENVGAQAGEMTGTQIGEMAGELTSAALLSIVAELPPEYAAALSPLLAELPAEPHAVIADQVFTIIRLPGHPMRLEIWCHSAEAATRLQHLEAMAQAPPHTAWTRAEIDAGVAHIDPSISEEHTPQLLNYDLSGAVNFEKGCYTGQEVVARMHYRGKVKKRLYKLTSGSDLSSGPVQQALRQADSPIEIISAVAATGANGEDGATDAKVVIEGNVVMGANVVIGADGATKAVRPSTALAIVSTELAQAAQPVQVADGVSVSVEELAY